MKELGVEPTPIQDLNNIYKNTLLARLYIDTIYVIAYRCNKFALYKNVEGTSTDMIKGYRSLVPKKYNTVSFMMYQVIYSLKFTFSKKGESEIPRNYIRRIFTLKIYLMVCMGSIPEVVVRFLLKRQLNRF